MTNLTPVAVKNAKPGPTRREIPDHGCRGLYLVVQPSGAKSWVYRYRFAGKPKKLTIGPVYLGADEPEQASLDQANTLAGARKLAGEAALQVAKGIDPARAKIRERDEARKRAEKTVLTDRDTVEAVAKRFIEKYAKVKTRESSWQQTARLLGVPIPPKNPAKPSRGKPGGEVISQWGDRPIREITKRDVLDLLDSIATRQPVGAPITANRVLAAVRKMFNWAVAQDIIATSPCRGVERPAPEQGRDRKLSDEELRLVWKAADAIGYPFGPLVKLLILTLQRRNEVAGIHRAEVNVTDRLWTIPAARVKNSEEHEVPLSAAALAILNGCPEIGEGGFYLTRYGNAPVSGFSAAKKQLDAKILEIQKAEAVDRGESPDDVAELKEWTFHDLRRSGSSGMARIGNIELVVTEKILNHTSGALRGVAGIYNRHEYADKKRAALDAWSDHIMALVAPTATK